MTYGFLGMDLASFAVGFALANVIYAILNVCLQWRAFRERWGESPLRRTKREDGDNKRGKT